MISQLITEIFSNIELLEKCLGKGRSSSRIASQKITSSAIESALLRRDSVDGVDIPDLADHDWKDKKKKRTSKKKDKQQSKRPKFSVRPFFYFSRHGDVIIEKKVNFDFQPSVAPATLSAPVDIATFIQKKNKRK